MKDRLKLINETFRGEFGTGATVTVRAPGRVNLIGEHTDYNDGFVLPCAISYDILMAGRARDDRKIRLYSLNFKERAEIDLDLDFVAGQRAWSCYVEGVVRVIAEHTGKPLMGFDAVVEGNVPVGAGLSSSAALEVATGMLVEKISGLEIAGETMARLCQEAEHRFAGVKCGIMDQFASRLSKREHALFLDCRGFEYEHVPINLDKYNLLILDTGISRGLVDSEYNARREACDQGVLLLREKMPEVRALRDVSVEEFLPVSVDWERELRDVCEHVVRENERVLRGVSFLKDGKLEEFGELVFASHESLRDKYRVSCRELDILHERSRGKDGVIGVRMTGAGFGGCAIALVERESSEKYTTEIKREYWEKTGKELKVYFTDLEDGASVIYSSK
ncbi:MAG: galactokinase [bacterium]